MVEARVRCRQAVRVVSVPGYHEGLLDSGESKNSDTSERMVMLPAMAIYSPRY